MCERERERVSQTEWVRQRNIGSERGRRCACEREGVCVWECVLKSIKLDNIYCTVLCVLLLPEHVGWRSKVSWWICTTHENWNITLSVLYIILCLLIEQLTFHDFSIHNQSHCVVHHSPSMISEATRVRHPS